MICNLSFKRLHAVAACLAALLVSQPSWAGENGELAENNETELAPASLRDFDAKGATFTEKFNQQAPFEVSFSPSNLKSYTEGLPTDFVRAERNFGQVDPAFEPEKPILWLKVRFDQENTLRSRISDIF